MANHLLTNDGYVYTGLEGVGSYGSAASLTTASRRRVKEMKLVKTPSLVPSGDLMPRRQGDALIKTGHTIDVSFMHVIREFTNPGTDTGARPESDFALVGGGNIAAWSNPSGNLYRTTYTPQDFPSSMNSVTVRRHIVSSDGADVLYQGAVGCRWDINTTYTPGMPIEVECTGKGIGWVSETMTGAGPASLTYDSVAPVVFRGDAVTLAVVGGSSYSGPIHSMAKRMKMNVVEIPGGDLSGVAEVQLVPNEHWEFDVVIDAQEVADVNGLVIRDAGSYVSMTLALTCATATNTYNEVWYGQIQSVEETDVGGHMAYTLKCVGVYSHASTPGVIPAAAPVVYFESDLTP